MIIKILMSSHFNIADDKIKINIYISSKISYLMSVTVIKFNSNIPIYIIDNY